jgi:EAL and modified HD-GYP domain-containing signal transduction protein
MADKRSSLFLMGLLSVADALLDKRMDAVLASLPVAHDVKTALAGGDNRLRDVFEAVLVWERAEWAQVAAAAARIGCEEEKVSDAYRVALEKASVIGV